VIFARAMWIVNKQVEVSKVEIYVAHRRETSNALEPQIEQCRVCPFVSFLPQIVCVQNI